MYSVARLCPDQAFLSLCHRPLVAVLCMLCKVNLNLNHCLFSELPSAFVRVRHIRAAAAAHPLEFKYRPLERPNLQYVSCQVQTRVWNDLPYTVFDTGKLDGFKGAVNRCCFPEFVCQFSVTQVLVGLRNQFINKSIFSTLACVAGFNNNKKNNNNNYSAYQDIRREM